MKLTGQTALFIAVPGAADPLSRARKQFNLRMKKLDELRTRLAAWKETMPIFRRSVEQDSGRACRLTRPG